jgi:asparagine synthase (glutamine-hydrolysing)
MCGITGWVAFDGDLTAEGTVLGGMTATLRRRGPDGCGIWLARYVVWGTLD